MTLTDTNQVRDISVSIDRGGTFTDLVGTRALPDGTAQSTVLKILSVDPRNYADANVEGIRRVLEHFTGQPHPRGQPLDTSRLASIRLGTTVATNALLERNGEPCALLITKGFKDLLHIGNQSRPNIFDLKVLCPDVLYDAVVEVDERVTLLGYTISPAGAVDDATAAQLLADTSKSVVRGITGELVQIHQRPDLAVVEARLRALYNQGLRSVAICLLHSYTFADHEQMIAEVARKVGFTNVTASAEIMPRIKAVPRGMTAVTDAYLTPKIKQYVESFVKGFKTLDGVKVEFMRSDGGLTPVEDFRGYAAILSGPAGGVVGYALTSYSPTHKTPIIGFDMGGTSTDVSRYAGTFDHVFETTTAGITITTPQLDIHTVAAGGSSRLFFRNGMLGVGPESAGSEPGPICYRKPGGVLAITDANLFLGRISVKHFPHIFGPTENMPLDVDATARAFADLTDVINAELGTRMTPDQVAFGFIKVANETMGQKVLAITQAKGYDVEKHTLACFGGAAAQHAVAVARNLNIKRVFVHRHAPILSAYGLSLASVVHEESEPCQSVLEVGTLGGLRAKLTEIEAKCVTYLCGKGFDKAQVEVTAYFNLRYDGTDTALMIACPSESVATSPEAIIKHLVAEFESAYVREFGFKLDRKFIVDDVRVRASAQDAQAVSITTGEDLENELAALVRTPAPPASLKQSMYFEQGGRIDAPLYVMHDGGLVPGHTIAGPALILDKNTTVVVPPGAQVVVTESTLVIDVNAAPKAVTAANVEEIVEEIPCDPIQLSLFGHRFMHIAEQMGRTLQKTSVSTNIKERLDFSCALFSPQGHLISNAPHVPVHLGSMQEAVKFQLNAFKNNLFDGDVLVSNHPACGGSHLPDITVITPVFHTDGQIIFFVASRGHHADIGGISPGSMPPNSKYLWEEGAMIKGFKIVSRGKFDEAGISALLLEPGKYPGCTGTRNLRDNLSDLRAQIAANHRGITLCQGLIREYGLRVVHKYMDYITENAAGAVKQLLKDTAKRLGTNVLHAVDYMDDGSPIELTVTIDKATGQAVFDFEGTGHEVFGNVNAPPAVTNAAIIYCLRAMLDMDIPLNQGCLHPVDIRIPKGSLLKPSDAAAVVGGNVMTSQRVVDVILRAFQYCAASQGDCNNLTFGVPASQNDGSDGFGFYETIAGGAGAGPTWDGRSGVHTHMTNTRITDVEIMERRYPVILRQFSLRSGSGGDGKHRGGDGVVREFEFTIPLQVSILSERRVHAPYGMHGGKPGRPGQNLLVKRGGRTVNLGGKNSVMVDAGDAIMICTPGAGGYGKPRDSRLRDEAMVVAEEDGSTGSSVGEVEVDENVNVPYRTSGSYLQRTLDQYSA
ncbi:Hydantoinase B/oxoprolinase-domain-containing protein [Catenaria anguillulae PL171]|uniref:Hydantoinase B/oxoprolinase-domain-containing protein n=1 Tax=Catenaria anguillulae PL171 TaxID=765915 RepID=A0A1Y2HQ93_9FUNG|nr:Hydantoinase B/oxoprolinase-domain-containing protein [Catenaria anguillulae PL171]